MFDIERWNEIFSSIKNNKLRVILSGSTVALGLYIFIVLLGIGKGLQNTFSQAFNGQDANSITIFGSFTSKAYAGMQKDREITLKNEDYTDILKNNPELKYTTSYNIGPATVRYGKESGTYPIYGVNPDQNIIENQKLVMGRFLSPIDFKQQERVAVIGKMMQRDLIKGVNPLGKFISINGVMFRIVGVFSSTGGDMEERKISVPINVIQQIKKGTDKISKIIVTYSPDLTLKNALKISDNIETELKKKKRVAPDDESGIYVRNTAETKKEQARFMYYLTLIVGVIGLGTLIAGIISISNIMIYTVKERTKEIGIRKAIGAKPFTIVLLILQESILVTVVSGALGISLGVITLRLVRESLKKYQIINPAVDWNIILIAFICLLISGTLAGFFPAYKSSKIKPIQALQNQ